jgi:hypothetical protein
MRRRSTVSMRHEVAEDLFVVVRSNEELKNIIKEIIA